MTRALIRLSVPAATLALVVLAGCMPVPSRPAGPATSAPDPMAPEMTAPILPAPLAPRDRLIAAIEQNGCLLTADNVGAILLRADLTRDELVALTPQLAAEGRAEVAASGTIRILSQNCI